MVWVETNKESPADLSVKDQETLKQEYELMEFASNVAEEFKNIVKKTKTACVEFYRRVLFTYNWCLTSAEKRLEVLPEHELFLKHLQDRYNKDEQAIQQVKDLDEWILKNEVAHAAVSIHLLEDQMRLIPTRIEGVKTQASKYNIRFLEPSRFESIATDVNAWKKFTNEQAGPSL